MNLINFPSETFFMHLLGNERNIFYCSFEGGFVRRLMAFDSKSFLVMSPLGCVVNSFIATCCVDDPQIALKRVWRRMFSHYICWNLFICTTHWQPSAYKFKIFIRLHFYDFSRFIGSGIGNLMKNRLDCDNTLKWRKNLIFSQKTSPKEYQPTHLIPHHLMGLSKTWRISN